MIDTVKRTAAGDDPMPLNLEPMLAVASGLPESDAGWSYEFKWDGVRAIVIVSGKRATATSRNGKDLTASFPELAELGETLGATDAILDGEVVAFGDDGRPSFQRLQQRLHVGSPAVIARRAAEVPVKYLAFDLLYLDGRSLVELPYEERRRLLEELELDTEHIATPPSISDRSGAELLALSLEHGLEGIVGKRTDSRYAAGKRNGDWIKVKNFRMQEVIIGGWTEGKGERHGSLGALLLGIPGEDGLDYVGKVGTGFDQAARQELLALLAPLSTDATPFARALPRAEAVAAHFVRPEVVGEVQYGESTADGRLRHPSWRGIRPDKLPADVVREP